MSPADRIAYAVKCQPLSKMASAVLIGQYQLKEILFNTQACDPPDLSSDRKNFCGLNVIVSHEENRLALIIDIPPLTPVQFHSNPPPPQEPILKEEPPWTH